MPFTSCHHVFLQQKKIDIIPNQPSSFSMSMATYNFVRNQVFLQTQRELILVDGIGVFQLVVRVLQDQSNFVFTGVAIGIDLFERLRNFSGERRGKRVGLTRPIRLAVHEVPVILPEF